jgi:acyl-[acyl-carrier-protein]-phospholipid O-acyltransferase/long-chain-fatty-acid--[acyl-carrier-protein] ligase
MSTLLKIKGASPYLFAIFLNAFIDLGHKIIIQNTIFKIYDGSEQVILTAIVNGLILLPFIVLFTLAGFVSDKFPKHQVMRLSSWIAVVLSFAITACYYAGLFWPAFFMTFLLAVQSAFFSPAKYGYIKALFGKERLARANGLAQAVSIMAILAGTFAFTLLFEWLYPRGVLDPSVILSTIAPVGWLLVFNSLLQVYFMYRIPVLEKTDTQKIFVWNDHLSGNEARQSIQLLSQRRAIRYAIIGLAMFWSIGQVLLASYPAFAKEQLAISNTIFIQGILAGSGIGIALGAAIVARFSRHHIEMSFVPVGAIGIALGLTILPQVGSIGMAFLDFIFIGAMGGFFIVPLNALIQFHAQENELGRVVASSNWIQNISMMSFLLITVMVSLLGFGSDYLLLMIAVVSVIGGAFVIYKLPQSLVRVILFLLVRHSTHLKVDGVNTVPEYDGLLLTTNHHSLKTWLMASATCPRQIRPVIFHCDIYPWYVRYLLVCYGAIYIAESLESVEESIRFCLKNNEAVFCWSDECDSVVAIPAAKAFPVYFSGLNDIDDQAISVTFGKTG